MVHFEEEQAPQQVTIDDSRIVARTERLTELRRDLQLHPPAVAVAPKPRKSQQHNPIRMSSFEQRLHTMGQQ